MSHKKKVQKNVYLGITLGLALAVLTVGIASVTSLQGSVTSGYNCMKNPVYRGGIWQNRKNTLDVNADGVVTKADANIIIAKLNEGGEMKLWKIRPKMKSPPYIDVDGDLIASPKDVLFVANYLNNCFAPPDGNSIGGGTPGTGQPGNSIGGGIGGGTPGNSIGGGTPGTGQPGNSIGGGTPGTGQPGNSIGGGTPGTGQPGNSYGGSQVNPWNNPAFPADVNGDGFVSPIDVLAVINEINNVGSHALDQSGPAQAFKIDTNNDGYVSPVDVMIVNNALNNQ